ncbi:type II toxin-antitoxin system HipA family toxin [Castellaniella caeni]
MRSLNVYQAGHQIGTLYDEQPLRFVYDTHWLATPAAQAIAPAFPLQAEPFAGGHVHAFFENLLPEGPVRRLLQASHHASTTFGLLRSVAGDTAGSLILLPPGELPKPPAYHITSWQHIAEQLRQGKAPTLGAQIQDDMRVSLAGAQAKILLTVLDDGRPAIPVGTAPSSHILKPDIQGIPGVWASALNETLAMQLADNLGLGTATAVYQADTRACLIRRYDRQTDAHGGLTRLHQLDLCQLAGVPSDLKYESDGGPSLAQCRYLLQEIGVPAKDLKRLLQWVIFNLLIGNHDSHAKNLSVLATPSGWQLAPFYDLMCTTVYPGLSRQFAFRIGGTNQPGQIGSSQIQAMASVLGMSPHYALGLARDIAHALPPALDKTIKALQTIVYPGTEHTLLERLAQRIKQETRKHGQRWGL